MKKYIITLNFSLLLADICPLNSNYVQKCQVDELSEDDCNRNKFCCWHEAQKVCKRASGEQVQNLQQNLNSNFQRLGLDRFQTDSILSQAQTSGFTRSILGGSDQIRSLGRSLNGISLTGTNYFGQQNSWGSGFMSMFGQNQNYGLGSVMATQLDQVPACPVEAPLCQRDPCLPGQPELDEDAYSCSSVKGCCFDMKIYLYKQFFGIYQKVPTCYRAIKSPLYDEYVKMINPWLPEYSQVIAEKLKQFDEENPQSWGILDQCPYNDQHSVPMAIEIFQRYSSVTGSPAPGVPGVFTGANSGYGMAGPFSGLLTALQGAMMGMRSSGMNPMLLLGVVSDGGSLLSMAQKIITMLSANCGWDDIQRFDCQMIGCCWSNTTTGDGQFTGRCVKAFRMSDWPNNDEFKKAMNTAIGIIIEGVNASELDKELGNQPPIPTGILGRKKRQLPTFGGMFGAVQQQNRMNAWNQPAQSNWNQPQNNWNQQQSYNQQNIQPNPRNNLMIQMLMSGGDKVDMKKMLERQMRMQSVEHVTQWAAGNQSPQCPKIEIPQRKACLNYGGNMIQDMQLCQARGCCFDAFAWTKHDMDLEDEKEKDQPEEKVETRSSGDPELPAFLFGRKKRSFFAGQSNQPQAVA